MPALSQRARWRVVSLGALCAFAGVTFAPPALACETGDDRTAPGQPIVHEFVMLQPQLSATIIGLAMAQIAALPPPAAPALGAPAPALASVPSIVRPTARPRGLVPLFASYAVLQALDVHSTLKAIDGGAVERNPLIAPIASRPAAFVALKVAATAGGILAADRLAKRNRVAAYALMFALNSAYAFVVVHNYKVAGR